MKLADVVRRGSPAPWVEGGKIPWDEPGFSTRMLREHLSQEHDAASRRATLVDAHVAWLFDYALGGVPGKVVDLGCGPGLYTSRLARRGCHCLGIDFSPASIEYARAEAEREGLPCEYRLRDLRDGDFGAGHALVLLCNGEFNVFRREQARALLGAAHASLAPGGRLVLELHDEPAVERQGRRAPTWYSAASGLFSERSHLCLRESAWCAEERAAVNRYYIVDCATGEVERHADTMLAWSDAELRNALGAVGFADIEAHASLDGAVLPATDDLFVLTARAEGDGSC